METTKIIEDVIIPSINLKMLTLDIKSRQGSSLIMHRFAEKARKQIRDKEAQKAKGPRAKRQPKKEYEEAKHLLPDGSLAMPAAAFFNGILDAAIAVANVTKTGMRRALFVIGDQGTDLVKINGEAQMREDWVTLGGVGRSVDLRYRPEMLEWTATLNIEYDADQISPEQITNLVQRAGYGSGIGDWRPSSPKKPGPHGRYQIA